MNQPIIITPWKPSIPRLRVRKVSEDHEAELALDAALEKKRVAIRAAHGGSVANSYGYKAETETLVTVAFPLGYVVQWHDRANANKVTFAWAGDLFDKRCGKARKKTSRQDWITKALQAIREKDPVLADLVEANSPNTLAELIAED